MSEKLEFSRFSHTYEKDDVVAIFHALKMKPVFLGKDVYNTVKRWIESGDIAPDTNLSEKNERETVVTAIEALKENRVLNEQAGRDKEVIEHFRRNIETCQIKIAYFILAESCNLACDYCFEQIPSNTNAESSIMSEEVACKAVSFFERLMLIEHGASIAQDENYDLIFYGGEPLLNYPVLRYTLQKINERKANESIWEDVDISIVTNGTLLTDRVVKELAELGVSISISVDGPKDITDKHRRNPQGGSVFDSILEGIRICKKAGVDFGLSITLSEEAVENHEDVMEFIAETQPSSIGFNILMDHGIIQLPKTYDDKAASFLLEAFVRFREKGLYEDRMMRKVNAFINSQVYPFDCGATGGNQIVVAPSGQVGICHGYLNNKKFFPTTVDDLTFNPKEDRVFQEWAERTPLNMEECQICPALGICGGGCPMNAEKTCGTIWGLDERFCSHAKKTLEWLVWDLYDKTCK